jgi:hypothetical protein
MFVADSHNNLQAYMHKKLILFVALFASQVCFGQTLNPVVDKVDATTVTVPVNNSFPNKNNDAFIKDAASAYKPSGGTKHFLKSLFPSLEKYYDHQINKFLAFTLFGFVIVAWLLRRVLPKSSR